jgi:alkylhydroperoxidase family enzyme
MFVSRATRYGRAAGLADDEIEAARRGTSADPARAAALGFARILLDTNGQVPDAGLAAVRAVGFDDTAIIEIAATVALNVFANLINNLAHHATEVMPTDARDSHSAAPVNPRR